MREKEGETERETERARVWTKEGVHGRIDEQERAYKKERENVCARSQERPMGHSGREPVDRRTEMKACAREMRKRVRGSGGTMYRRERGRGRE